MVILRAPCIDAGQKRAVSPTGGGLYVANVQSGRMPSPLHPGRPSLSTTQMRYFPLHPGRRPNFKQVKVQEQAQKLSVGSIPRWAVGKL